jgi:AraC-like DNA-binding protein
MPRSAKKNANCRYFRFEIMTKLDRSYEPHLVIREMYLPPGLEWVPRFSGWSLIQVGAGTGYFLKPGMNQGLEPGMVLLLAAEVQGNIRASQLGGLTLYFFSVEPERLTGLITMEEQAFFETAAAREKHSMKILPPQSQVATKMTGVCADRAGGGSSFRLQLIQLFFEAFGNELMLEPAKPDARLDAKERLQEFLRQMPAADLLGLDFSELAQMTRCTPRHLSRIFHEVVGASFRERHTELRLARARELLATTESKVVDVAMESGYQSLSLFNLMFTRRFGMSPGRWRQTLRNNKSNMARGRAKTALSRP